MAGAVNDRGRTCPALIEVRESRRKEKSNEVGRVLTHNQTLIKCQTHTHTHTNMYCTYTVHIYIYIYIYIYIHTHTHTHTYARRDTGILFHTHIYTHRLFLCLTHTHTDTHTSYSIPSFLPTPRSPDMVIRRGHR